MQLPEPVQKVLSTLEENGYEAYLVGGSVRDMLLGKTPHDYDIATSAKPEEVLQLFGHTIPSGIAHGTVIVVEGGMPVEVTTFRKDGVYEDHRHPKQVEFVSDLPEDLRRRDFTINAMAWHPKKGLIDPFGGQQDLKDGIIRAVGDPDARFKEDALRMVRAFRFASRLGFDIDEATCKAIHDNERLIDDIAVERLVPEFTEILQNDPLLIDQMTGLLKKWIPELEVMAKTDQINPHHYTDVLHHTLDAVAASPSKDPAVLWALLLHDAGKPAVKTTDENGDHFKKHPFVSCDIAKRVVKDLKMRSSLQKEIPELVLYHDSFYAPRLSNLYKLRVQRKWSDDMVHKLFDVQRGDILGHTTYERMQQLEDFRKFYDHEKERHPLALCDLQINGDDIMARTDLQGKEIQSLLNLILEDVFYHPELDSRQAQLELIDKLQSKARKAAGSAPRSKNAAH